MFFKSLLVFLTLIIFQFVNAQTVVTITGVTGASKYIEKSTDNSVPFIYGGIAGDSCTADSDYETCDSCELIPAGVFDSGDILCNETRIYSNLKLVLQYTSDKSGDVQLLKADGTTTISGSGSSAVAGQTNSFEVQWSSLCALDEGKSCVDFKDAGEYYAETLYIGVDGNNDGSFESNERTSFKLRISGALKVYSDSSCDDSKEKGLCDMLIEPGDGKAYLETISTLPDSDSPFDIEQDINIEKVRIMYAKSFAELSPSGGNYKDFDVVSVSDTKDGLSSTIISGLSNDQAYAFGFANIDSAGNLSYIMSGTLFTSACPSIGLTDNLALATDAEIEACPYTAMPGEVIGLLKNDVNCFIATATYGSSWDKRVVTFRKFRNTFLLTNSIGKYFVKAYYKYGSIASHWIYNKPVVKNIVKVLLWPIYAITWVLLLLGPLGSLATALLFIGFGIFRKIKTQKGY